MTDFENGSGCSSDETGPFGLYLHIPFCASKCLYCHFASETGIEQLIPRYISALINEYDQRVCETPSTAYIGGGTPSLIPPDILLKLLSQLSLHHTSELTIEANPESLNMEWLDTALQGGCTRISIGIQSLHDSELVRLGRLHSSVEGVCAVERAGSAGFQNISIDLMYGIPGQTVDSFRQTLTEVCALTPAHISAYALSIEQDTAYANMQAAQGIHLPDNDEISDMYRMMNELLASNGFERYEISNFAHPGYECRHNLAYWDFTPYIGIGVSAHSFDGSMRSWNVTAIGDYLGLIEQGNNAFADTETISKDMRLDEQIMLSLRTSQGLDTNILNNLPVHTIRQCHELIERSMHAGLLTESSDGRIVLTTEGALLADEVIAELFACLP